MSEPEYWLRGPVAGVAPLLQPVAHALLQARDDVLRVSTPLTAEQLWTTPGGAASVGFHVKHLTGSLGRLFGYARGAELSAEQLAYLNAEKDSGDPPASAATLLSAFAAGIDRALDQVRSTPETILLEPRSVGRQHLPSTVLGLMFHGAEHTTRHAGQIITTAKIVTASAPSAP
jgi:uncharacterized damage-inducible protein DinB